MDVYEVARRLEQVEVPKTLHELLRQGIDDLRRREHDKRYTIDMGMWHMGGDPDIGERCIVCLAGSWLSGRGFPPEMGGNDVHVISERVDENDEHPRAKLPEDVGDAMTALNCLRTGDVDMAVGFMYGPDDLRGAALNRLMPEYDYNPDTWHEHAERLYDDLKQEGL